MQLFKNNSYSALAGSLTTGSTSMSVSSGTGDRFPVVAGADFAMVTLQDAANNIEIVKVTARTLGADAMTITRAQEGTTARAWAIGDVVEVRMTAGGLAPLQVFAGAATAVLLRVAIGISTFADGLVTAVDAATARSTLGLGSAATQNSTAFQPAGSYQPSGSYAASGSNNDITSLTGLTTPLSIAQGGTGSTTGAQQPGEVCYFAKSTAPSGFLKANGALVSRTTYAALFAAIGTTFGVGDGSTTFALPDLRGEFIRGWDDARGVDTGRAIGTAQEADIAPHTHSLTNAWMRNSAGVVNLSGVGGAADGMVGATGNNSGTETRPRNVALLACIKY